MPPDKAALSMLEVIRPAISIIEIVPDLCLHRGAASFSNHLHSAKWLRIRAKVVNNHAKFCGLFVMLALTSACRTSFALPKDNLF